jgi:hypothetical protein
MSRLDDELKLAFRRQEPSADFTDRVLARIAAEQRKPQKVSLWQRLLGWFQMPTLGLAVAAAAVLLIAVLGVIQYQRSHPGGQEKQTTVANSSPSDNSNSSTPGLAANGNANSNPVVKDRKDEAVKPFPNKEPHGIQHVTYRPKRKALPKRFKTDTDVPEGQVADGNPKDRNPKAMTEKERGEQAKEQLYKALAITSTLLSEARTAAFK